MSQPDNTIRKQVVRDMIDDLGGYGLLLSPGHSALAYTGYQALRRYWNDKAAEFSGTRAVFDGHLRVDDDAVGLSWATTGIGQSVRFSIIRQPDKTYSIFLIRKTRSSEWQRDPRGYVLLDEAHDISSGKLAMAVKQMYDARKKRGW